LLRPRSGARLHMVGAMDALRCGIDGGRLSPPRAVPAMACPGSTGHHRGESLFLRSRRARTHLPHPLLHRPRCPASGDLVRLPEKVANGVSDIRSQFPALERMHNGLPVAYFDAPGGTQVPRRVADAMTDYLFHHNANTHWAYPTSEETDAIITDARAAAGEFLRCAADEIVFGANMTTLTF